MLYQTHIKITLKFKNYVFEEKMEDSKNIKKSVKVDFLLIVTYNISSCINDEFLEEEDISPVIIDIYEEGVQIENPYTVKNMQKAMDTIKAKVARGEYSIKNNDYESQRSSEFSILDEVNITTTHHYIEFSPTSEEEILLLKRTEGLTVTDYPLDYDFPDSFFENRLEPLAGNFPKYYSTVSINQTLPSIDYLVLGELYIPEKDMFFYPEEEQLPTKESIISNEEDVFHHLLYEAYSLTNNVDKIEDGILIEEGTGQRIWIFGRRWRPSGRIRVWDELAGSTPVDDFCFEGQIGVDYSGCTDNDGTFTDCPEYIYGEICVPQNPITGSYVPLVGAQVLMRQLFTVDSGIVEADGTFTTGTVRGSARYVIQWERFNYSIRNGLVFQAELRGPSKNDAPWFKDIFDGDDKYHALIHAAAHYYFYQNQFDISRPSNAHEHRTIAAMEINGQSSNIPFAATASVGIAAQILIKEWDSASDRVYGTTIHELAHAAHQTLDNGSYTDVVGDAYTSVCFTFPIWPAEDGCNRPLGPTANNNRRLMETWATTVETLFTIIRYRDLYGDAMYEYRGNLQAQDILADIHYTAAGFDMLEGNYGLAPLNQHLNDVNNPIDNVNGFTIEQLENALDGSRSWNEWRDRLFEQNPGNPTRNNLNELFGNW